MAKTTVNIRSAETGDVIEVADAHFIEETAAYIGILDDPSAIIALVNPLFGNESIHVYAIIRNERRTIAYTLASRSCYAHAYGWYV